MAVGNVICERFLVEDAGSKGTKVLPGCKGASKRRDGGEGLAESNTLLFAGECALFNDEWLVSTALGAGDLYKGVDYCMVNSVRDDRPDKIPVFFKFHWLLYPPNC